MLVVHECSKRPSLCFTLDPNKELFRHPSLEVAQLELLFGVLKGQLREQKH